MPDPPSTQKLSVNVRAQTKRELRRLAHSRSLHGEEQVTMSDLVNEALEEYLAGRAGDQELKAAEDAGRYEPRTDA